MVVDQAFQALVVVDPALVVGLVVVPAFLA